ncbi:MAG TPA: hypothetical protein VND93_11225 [Myxococcales bacterium]|jgi:hypothetical protein|nr:hypothetical protein [Myxococcales bacterium]
MGSPPRVGTVAWERAGGPPLSPSQRAGLLARAGGMVASHFLQRWRWRLGGRRRFPPRVDLSAWAAPDTAAAREAEAHLREALSPQMVNHSFRTYFFSAIASQLAREKPDPPLDRETLYVAALMHDVTLGDPAPPPGERCFTVGCARRARQIATRAGWEPARQDRMAMAITSNLNLSVPAAEFGPEAHFMSAGGRVEVLAEEWRVHPENLAEILARYPRDGFARDALVHVALERRRHPGCRFACLHPAFPVMLAASRFTLDR